ncbi:MAG: hypothetical protein K5765_00255 [Clostridia bacterium]|nr:hypothetical protein [Clostridia bacterium]
MDINELYSQALKKSYEEKVTEGKMYAKEIVKYFNTIYEVRAENDYIFMKLLCAFLGADGKLTQDEFKYIQDIFEKELDFLKIQDFLQNMQIDDTKELIYMLTETSPEIVRISICKLGTVLSTVDGEITKPEKEFIKMFAN